MPQVDLKLLTRPVETRQYLRTYRDVMGYQHVKVNQGGDDSMTCQIALPLGQAIDFIDNNLGCRVEFFILNPEKPVSEGYIDRITLESGELQETRSFDSMVNRAVVTYDANGSGAVQQSLYENTTAQERYGIRYGSVDGGVNFHASNATHKRAIKELIVNLRSYPSTSTVYGGREGAYGLLTIECKGIQYWAYDWVDHNDSSSTTLHSGSAWLTAYILPLASNTNAPYVISSSDTTLIETQTAWSHAQKNISGGSIWQQMLSFVEAGDQATRWVLGVAPYSKSLGYHRFYYRAAETSVTYRMYTRRGNMVYDVNGQRVYPWEMQPDNGIRIVDGFGPPTLLPLNLGEGDNPNVAYLTAVRYDADSNKATWQSDDDLTMEGVMQLSRLHKIINKKIGAPLRQKI